LGEGEPAVAREKDEEGDPDLPHESDEYSVDDGVRDAIMLCAGLEEAVRVNKGGDDEGENV